MPPNSPGDDKVSSVISRRDRRTWQLQNPVNTSKIAGILTSISAELALPAHSKFIAPACNAQSPRAVRYVCSRLYGKGVQYVNFPDQSYSPELLHLMCIALDSAWSDQQRYCGDDMAGRALRTAMAFQIMMAVSAGRA